jgi:4,5-DOPA dioxygenase extradiol
MTLRDLKTAAASLPKTARLPALFIGHGSPMNGVEDNEFSRAWIAKSAELPAPQAILCISAHWFTPGTFVHTAKQPRTIHDFYGFPEELYALRYPCPGAPEYAALTADTITTTVVTSETDWGIDHGAWIVLRRLFPLANIPVFQMSIDYTKPGQFHYDLGKELATLRERGVLIIGSGNIVHNLGRIEYDPHARPFSWAEDFDALAEKHIAERNHRTLIHYEKLGASAHLAVPTPDHFYPLLYILGAQHADEQMQFFAEGITHGSISMRSFIAK